ncbi:MAG: DUF4292 domain-containing protein [Balneolales bacterium]
MYRNIGSRILFLLIVAVSCSPPEILRLETGEFKPATIDKERFYEQYASTQSPLASVSGRANVQVSEPGNTDRFTLSFSSNRNYSLLTLRNNLGMEGGRIYSNPDSVLIYNRLEEKAHKMSHVDASLFYLNGITALNLIQMIQPITDPEHISRLYENEDYFLVETNSGERHFIEREQMNLIRTERDVIQPGAYRTFNFDSYAEIEGYRIPRRIQILSSKENSNIFLVIRSLEINPPDLDFDPEIPGDIEIIRI